MISIQISEKPDSSWNKRFTNSQLGTIFQTIEYANFVEKKHWKPIFLSFINQTGDIVGQLLLYETPRFRNDGTAKNLLKKLPGSKKIILRWMYGPVVFNDEFRNDILTELREYLLSKKSKVIGSEHPLSNLELASLGSPFKLQKWSTFLIDLSEDTSSLWAKLDKHSARKNVERSKKRGVIVKEMNDKDLKNYHTLLKQTKSKVDWDIEYESVSSIWKSLKPVGFSGFMATLNDIPIGGLLVSSFNNYINEWGVARSELDTSSKLYSQDLLKWKIIEWGISHNFKYYDLTGVNPNSTTEKEAGIFRYKKKWGGKLVEYDTCIL